MKSRTIILSSTEENSSYPVYVITIEGHFNSVWSELVDAQVEMKRLIDMGNVSVELNQKKINKQYLSPKDREEVLSLDGNWHHIAFVFNNYGDTSVETFIDGTKYE